MYPFGGLRRERLKFLGQHAYAPSVRNRRRRRSDQKVPVVVDQDAHVGGGGVGHCWFDDNQHHRRICSQCEDGINVWRCHLDHLRDVTFRLDGQEGLKKLYMLIVRIDNTP